MLGTQNPQLHQAVADAVRLVNNYSGQTNVRIRFRAGEPTDVDLVANTASLHGDRFTFTAGFQTVDGTVAELAGIQADVIGR
jgi:hypothetical protein